MIGIALKREGGAPADIYFVDNGLAVVRDNEAVGQHVEQRLMAYEGEWFLDNEVGLPWIQEILGGVYDPSLAESVIKAEILDTAGVAEITSFSVRFDLATRGLGAYSIVIITDEDKEVAV